MLTNPKDPLLKVGPDAERELFMLFGRAANGFPTDVTIGAALNMIINAMRQQHTTRAQAEKAFDEMFGRGKTILTNHYDSLGRKRGIFPYDQNIVMPMYDARPKN